MEKEALELWRKYEGLSYGLRTLVIMIEARGLEDYFYVTGDGNAGEAMEWPELKQLLVDVDKAERESYEAETSACTCPEWKKEIMLRELGEPCCSKNTSKK